jgi:DNA-binding transcriptional regulator LsrR (DeoR family)
MAGPPIADALKELIGEDAYLALVEHYGGTRAFVPKEPARSGLAAAIGEAAAEKLSKSYGAEYIKVPLDRELRARHYKGQGLSNAAIARRLGITESAVEKLFSRARKSASNDQLSLF